jgi:D-beta-D-heptose 7-phosphate kinase/D-beta-D-heptose 1-phosphate adenosyltransferase
VQQYKKYITIATQLHLDFAFGVNQNNNSIPELFISTEFSIDLIAGLGVKVQSSSWLHKNT